MIKYGSLLLLVTWFLSNACLAIACDESAYKSLDTNLQKWKSVGWNQYSYVLERQCFCPPEYRKATQIFVENGKVVSANYVEDAGNTPVSSKVMSDLGTIEYWFEVIRNAHERKADLINVIYDSKLGFPNKIEIDMRTRRADDEQSVIITNVVRM